MPWDGAMAFLTAPADYWTTRRQVNGALPNRKELMSLLDRSQCCLALPAGSPFLNQEWGSYYWTSSTFAWDTPYAWIVSMRVGTVYYNPKATGSAYVVPVRGGPGRPSARRDRRLATEHP